MAKKNYYYVLVMAEDGPAFVTSVKRDYCYWNKSDVPKELGKAMAEEITMGLRFNGTSSFTVYAPYEITYQPYNYTDYECKFVEKEEDNAEK